MRSFLGLWFKLVVLTSAIMVAQNANAIGGTVTVRPVAPLRKGIQAFPRLVASHGYAVLQINRSLDVYDRSVLKASRQCNIELAQSSSALGYKLSKKPSWERSVKVTMRGPRFVSYRVDDLWFCGGNHPNSSAFALTYDLEDGTLVDWTRLLSASVSRISSEKTSDGAPANAISSDVLTEVYVSRAKPEPGSDCPAASVFAHQLESFGRRLAFAVWPDAASGRLVIKPSLPHVIYGCGVEVALGSDEQRALGLAEPMFKALKDAPRPSPERAKR